MDKKVVLVTGASSGIGLAIASYLSKKGYKVYGGSRSTPPSELFHVLKLDVTNDESVSNAITQIIEKENRIDVLINNAGVGSFGAIEKTPINDAVKSFDINVFGVVRMCQAVLPYMREQGYGRIINVSTLGSAIGLPFRAFYSSSKGAMDLITETLRIEVDHFGIQACTIHPGEVNTNIADHRIVSMDFEDKSYGNRIKNAFIALNNSVNDGVDPSTFGPIVEKIFNSKKVKREYYLGTFGEVFGIKLKKFLPYYVSERIIKSFFKVD